MKTVILALAAVSFLIGQSQSTPQRVFKDADTTVTILWEKEGVFPLLHSASVMEADTAIVDIFYRYETPALGKLLLSVRVTCPVAAGIDSACDNAPSRLGFTLEAIEFVRIKYLRTTLELHHVSPQLP